MNIEQPPLPGMPEGPPPTPPRKQKAGVRVTRYRPRNRVLCTDCVELVHALGFDVAPVVRPARWTVAGGPGPTVYVCELHKDLRVKIGTPRERDA